MRARRCVLVWVCLLAALSVGCAGAGPASENPRALRAQDARASLRYRVASEPRDVPARLALARLEHDAGRAGAAFEHLAFVHAGNALPEQERPRLAALYRDRFRERLALGDGDAYRDAERASELHAAVDIGAAERAEGYLMAGLAALRRGNVWGRREAGDLFARAAELMPDDPRLTARLVTDAALADLGGPAAVAAALARAQRGDAISDEALALAALWLHRGGARRAALELLELYVRRGGRASTPLRAFVIERAWWSGAEAMPRLLLGRELRAAGVSLCLLAREPEDGGCADDLARVAVAEFDRSDEIRLLLGERLGQLGPPDELSPRLPPWLQIWQHAERLRWRTAAPEQVEAWALLALRAWLAGVGDSPEQLLAARVDVAAVVDSPALPAHLRPALLRALGRDDEAARALDALLAAPPISDIDALSENGGADASALATPGARLLLLAHAARRGWPRARLEALRGRWPELGALGAAVVARASAPLRWYLSGESAFAGAHAPAIEEGRAGRALARAWWSQQAAAGAAVAGALEEGMSDEWTVSLSSAPVPAAAVWAGALLPADAPLAVAEELAEAARAYPREPAVAERIADDLVARAVSVAVYGPALARLFAGLGDHARALAWRERIAAESPRHPPHAFGYAAAAAALGDVARADVLFEAAAAGSGDAGAAFLFAAGVAVHLEHWLLASSLGRRALQLTAPGRTGAALALLATAADGLGRAEDRERMRAAWLAQLPPDARAAFEAERGDKFVTVSEFASASAADALALELAAATAEPPERAATRLRKLGHQYEALGQTELAAAIARAARASAAIPAPRLPAAPPR